MKKNAPFGSWPSPISAERVAEKAASLTHVRVDSKRIFWDEVRPLERGKVQIILKDNKKICELLPNNYSARSRVNEFGGCSFVVKNNNKCFFINDEDQGIYQIHLDNDNKITPVRIKQQRRYIDLEIDERKNAIYCVEEIHKNKKIQTRLIRIDLNKPDSECVISKGYDFYSSVKLSYDNKKICFLRWNLPNMPWDGTELIVAEINDDGTIANEKIIAGSLSESICQPKWWKDGSLFFIYDKSQWWNIYKYENEKITSLYPLEMEFGSPDWIGGLSSYAILDDKTIVCSYWDKAIGNLGIIKDNAFEAISLPFTSFMSIQTFDENNVTILVGSPTLETTLILFDVNKKTYQIIKKSRETALDEENISIGQLIEFKGWEDTKTTAFYYPPKNKDYDDKKELPPLIVKCHSGPSSHCVNVLNWEIQFWTSRGFAVADVNYKGSTGHGRSYRKMLNEQWGVADVEDCISCAKYLIEQNKADKDRLIIRGGSAGGYTTLATLMSKDNIFNVGACYYGISDLEGLIQECLKFESKYLEHLIGPYPEKIKIYKERSPINFIDSFSCPVIFFQGGKDMIVKPSQTKKIYQALKEKNVISEYVFFEDEGHGFRSSENIKKCLNEEYLFYSKIFNFPT